MQLNSITLVNIFYGSLSYTESTEAPQMDGITLLGTIGGHMGLFLGVSLLTVGELISLCIEIFFNLKKKKIKPDKKFNK